MTEAPPPKPERTTFAGGSLEIPRMLNGLWQLAGGHDADVDIETAADAIDGLVKLGLDGFDMADHYGDAEVVIGVYNKNKKTKGGRDITAFTKWCPPEHNSPREAVSLALDRMGQEKIELLQYHCWDYTDETYLSNLSKLQADSDRISHLGLTNVDTNHLELLLDSGFRIATNQVSVSILDRRIVRGRMTKICTERGVGILAYGTLLGGFVSEKWIGQPEPEGDGEGLNWSLKKYLRFIRVSSAWTGFQNILKVLETVARKHDVSISAIAMRWVLDLPAVKAIIVGCRLNAQSRSYAARNLEVFGFELDEEDRELISQAQEKNLTREVPGDCGDEYRRAPFLTAAGDLRDHMRDTKEKESMAEIESGVKEGKRVEFCPGNSPWEEIASYSRGVRIGDTIYISGTTATPPKELQLPSGYKAIGGTSARSQTVYILDVISRALKSLGGELKDVVRTRGIVRRGEDVEEVSRVHGWVFRCDGIRPANTLTMGELVGEEFLVEIEAEAVVGKEGGREVVRISS